MLWLSETKVVIAFSSTSELMAAMHLLDVDTAWHDKPIRLHIHPPTNTKVRDYIAVRGRCPSGAHVWIPGEEVMS